MVIFKKGILYYKMVKNNMKDNGFMENKAMEYNIT